jgi:hypothetical protein
MTRLQLDMPEHTIAMEHRHQSVRNNSATNACSIIFSRRLDSEECTESGSRSGSGKRSKMGHVGLLNVASHRGAALVNWNRPP